MVLKFDLILNGNFERLISDVCFLRLDFENFNIQGVADTLETDGGACVDTFNVAVTTNQNIPQICGQNSGQHSK